jgi:pyruvate-formate lyase-activating enzyme
MKGYNSWKGSAVPTLRDLLNRNVQEADRTLYEKLDRNRVRCFACGHRCPIPEGQAGVCKVRYNQAGALYVPWGYVGGVQCDPIEKKPFFHAHPGALAYSFGMLGCDLHCSYCQNWVTSQALRDPNAVSPPLATSPKALVSDALRQGARILVSTYNEPLITSEWAVAIFKEAKAAGLLTAFVSNGNATPQVLEYLRPWIDLYKVDLKSFSDRHYHELGGRMGPILDTIRALHQMGVWLEIVTLLIPGFNDSDEELHGLSGQCFSRYSVACDCIPQGLQNAGASRHRLRRSPAGSGNWHKRGTAIRLRGELAGQSWRFGRYEMPRLWRIAHQTSWLLHSGLPTHSGRRLSRLQMFDSGALACEIWRPNRRSPVSARSQLFGENSKLSNR